MKVENGKIKFEEDDVIDFTTLGDIIGAWVSKFKEVHQDHPFKGVPNLYLPDGVVDIAEGMIEAGQEKYYEDLDKVIYAFTSEGPEFPDGVLEFSGSRVVTKDESAKNAYLILEAEHEKEVVDGMETFSRIFHTMWI